MAEENKETPIEESTTSDAEDAEEQDEQEVQEEEAATEEAEADDTPFDPSEYLQMKIKLEDDSEAFLFSFGPKCKESGGNRPLNCHLCRVASLRDDMKKGHIQSKLHQRNLKRKVKPERYTKPYRQFCGINEEGKLMQFEINPGEDIEEVLPEEHKDRLFYKEAQYVRPKPDDLKVLKEEKLHEYNKTKPLLGLNYIFKMKSGEQIMYFCALCNLKLKGDAFLHIAGATHQASYIIKHFPNLYAKVQSGLEEIPNEVAVEHCTRNIFRYLYRKIENKKKRARVNLVDFEYFQKNRDEIVKKCLERNHFDENTIKFPKAELDILIRKSLKGIEFIKPDLKSLANPELGFRTVVTPIVENQRPMMMPRDGPPPPKMRRPDLSGATPENWTAYRVMLGNMYDEINFKYKMFEQNPRSHPQHQYEWKMYLQQRIRELKRDKIDPRSHDIQSEWAPRWIQRLRQLYAKDLANRKRELKRLLNLPFDRSPSPIRQMDQQMPMHWQCEQQPQPPTPSPMFGAPNMIQGRPLPIFTEDTPIVSSEPLSVISVMRLLSALEDQLGSLGPKAVQLLSRAVLCEKDSGNTDQLLLDNDYYVFFATVKEKFRGQLQANVVEFSKRQAVSHCVNEISSILDVMEKSISVERERRKEMEQQKRIQQQQQEEQRQQQNQRKQQQGQQQQWQRGKMQQQGGKFDGGNNQQKNMGSNQLWTSMNDSFGASGFSGNNQKGNQGGGGDAGGNLMNKQQNRKRNAAGGGSMPFGNNNNSNRNFQGGNSKSFWQQGQGHGGSSGDNFSNSPNPGRFENSGNNFGNRNNDNSDNFGRGGGNNNPGRNFNNQRGNNAGGGGGGGGMKNFNDNFGGGRNFSGGNNNSGNRNMDNRNDNFSRDFDSRNDGGNQGGSTGGNFNIFSRNPGGPNKNDNFGKNFGSGGSNMSGGGDNFSGRGFGGNNQNRGFGGNNQGRNNNNSNNSREGGGSNLYSRRNDGGGSFGGLNSFGGNNNSGGNFNRPNSNFGGRMPGFNSNFN